MTAITLLTLHDEAQARVADASVARSADGRLTPLWRDSQPVDVLQGEAPDPAQAQVFASATRTGTRAAGT